MRERTVTSPIPHSSCSVGSPTIEAVTATSDAWQRRANAPSYVRANARMRIHVAVAGWACGVSVNALIVTNVINLHRPQRNKQQQRPTTRTNNNKNQTKGQINHCEQQLPRAVTLLTNEQRGSTKAGKRGENSLTLYLHITFAAVNRFANLNPRQQTRPYEQYEFTTGRRRRQPSPPTPAMPTTNNASKQRTSSAPSKQPRKHNRTTKQHHTTHSVSDFRK